MIDDKNKGNHEKELSECIRMLHFAHLSKEEQKNLKYKIAKLKKKN